MPATLIITGSPSSSSRTLRLARSLGERLQRRGLQSDVLDLRSLPAEDLMHARPGAQAIQAALAQLESARGVVVVTPIYKAAYSGLLKTFIDLLPQFGLREKVVLPLAMGGSAAHVLAIDYALRPMLSSLDPLHIVPGLFLQDKQVVVHEDGRFDIEPELSVRLDAILAAYADALSRAHPHGAPA